MRVALLVIAALALAGFVAVSWILPGMAGSKAKEAATALVAGTDALKQQVGAVAEKANSLSGAGAKIRVPSKKDPKFGELKWIVEPNGAIRGWNEENAIEISLTPTLQGGKVSWACRGYPNASMPATCGGRG